MQVRKIQQDDLAAILKWRNHPETRRCMINQHEISVEEHYNWFERANLDNSRALLMVEEKDSPLGCVIFSGAREDDTAHWSFYAVPDSPKGTGIKICSAALDFVFAVAKVRKVVGQVLDFNVASIRTHERLGFKQQDAFREKVMIKDTCHDLLYFELLSNKWHRSG